MRAIMSPILCFYREHRMAATDGALTGADSLPTASSYQPGLAKECVLYR